MKYVLLLFFCINAYPQNTQSKIDSIVITHVDNFRKFINDENVHIVVDFHYGFIKDSLNWPNIEIVDVPGFNPKKMKKNKDYFLIKFLFYYDDNKILGMKGINFRIRKISNKKIKLTNVGNGKNYYLN